MSRRASVFARLNPGKRRVRFPDEVMFEEGVKESDGDAIMSMLRRASVDIDVDRINMSGMTALHQVDKFLIEKIPTENYYQVDTHYFSFLCLYSILWYTLNSRFSGSS